MIVPRRMREFKVEEWKRKHYSFIVEVMTFHPVKLCDKISLAKYKIILT